MEPSGTLLKTFLDSLDVKKVETYILGNLQMLGEELTRRADVQDSVKSYKHKDPRIPEKLKRFQKAFVSPESTEPEPQTLIFVLIQTLKGADLAKHKLIEW